MHEILFYKDPRGKEPVLEYMRELSVYGTCLPKRELEKAKRELADFMERSHLYGR